MRTSAVVRIGLMAVLMAGLLFPLMMIYGLVSERAGRRAEAVREVSSSGERNKRSSVPSSRLDSTSRPSATTARLARSSIAPVFCPWSSRWTPRLLPDIRRRGLFEVIVYRARLRITGRFAPVSLSQWRVQPADVVTGSAMLSVGMADPRGIAGPIALTWDGKKGTFVPGAPEVGIGVPGISAPVPLPDTARDVWFSLELDANGTRELRFVPVGNDTVVRLASSWPHPSFVGAPLPKDRQVSSAGFTAPGWSRTTVAASRRPGPCPR